MASTEYKRAVVTLVRVMDKSIIVAEQSNGIEHVIGRSTLSYICDQKCERALRFPVENFPLEAMTWVMNKEKLGA